MSQELLQTKGRVEIPNKETRTSDYYFTDVHFTSFAGNTSMGRSLQIKFGEFPEFSHVQLNNEAVQHLKEILNNHY